METAPASKLLVGRTSLEKALARVPSSELSMCEFRSTSCSCCCFRSRGWTPDSARFGLCEACGMAVQSILTVGGKGGLRRLPSSGCRLSLENFALRRGFCVVHAAASGGWFVSKLCEIFISVYSFLTH